MDAKNKIKKILKVTLTTISVLVVGTILGAITYSVLDDNRSEKTLNQYYELTIGDTEALFEISDKTCLMFDSKAYRKFEDSCLGNKNSILISFGKYCEIGDIVAFSNTKTILKSDEIERIVSEQPASYLNIIDNYIYYRNDVTRELCRYSIDDEKTEIIIESQCGEIIVSKKGISYIDLNSQTLKYISFDTNEMIEIASFKVKSFAIIGDKYYCLKTNKELGVLTKSGDFNLISADVDRFYLDCNLAFQKGNNIYVYNGKSTIKSKIAVESGILIGLSENEIFVNENNKINFYNIETKNIDKEIFSIENTETLKAFYVTNNSYEIITCDNNISPIKEKQFTITKD